MPCTFLVFYLTLHSLINAHIHKLMVISYIVALGQTHRSEVGIKLTPSGPLTK